MNLSIFKISDKAYQVRDGEKSSSMLSRYGILTGEGTKAENDGNINVSDTHVKFSAKRTVNLSVTEHAGCFSVDIDLSGGERIFGLGDANRDSLMIRGREITLYKSNVRCYGPMPVLLSSDGWALLLNTTYKTVFDIGKKDEDNIHIKVYGGQADFYLFRSESLLGLIKELTRVTGRPMILPKYAYGLTVVNNENIGIPELLEYSRLYREYDIPCDIMGLEPGWMEKDYDFSTEKSWNKERFKIPYWMPENTSGYGTFFHPLRRMGMQLSLWLCEDYDLIYHEEKSAPVSNTSSGFPEDAEELDKHFASGVIYQDKLTKPEERWFEHLKKFVDNGASAFKLDASNQVLAHPDKLWGGKFTDDEVHNVYPVLLAKEMAEGFTEHTGRRSMIYTSCAYIGTQKYAATWAGDTGGGPKTLTSILNYAMCGHANASCDLSPIDYGSIHYSFLSSWAQMNLWAYWNYPWYLDEHTLNVHRFYSKLRSSLFPYIYYTAFEANTEGMPIMRPLPIVYDTDKYDGVSNAYMLGDSLYVGAFDMHLNIPEGEWVDYFTGETYEGGRYIDYEPKGYTGGALFVKAGSVIVTMKPQKYLLEKEHEYTVNLYPAEEGGETAIFEDDGFTYDYENGGYALTRITSSGIKDGEVTLTVFERSGSFDGRPDNGHDIAENSIPKISPMSDVTDLTVLVHGKAPKSALACGKELALTECDGKFSFVITADMRKAGDVKVTLKF